MNDRPDNIDKMVFSATHAVRKDYHAACYRLGLRSRDLTPPVLMQRSVR